MTRINTNVSSLNAQKTLAKSNAQLQQALTRLSTGLRINTGKDDPAGLIASENLRSDIIGAQKAISNSQSANQMIATADSALGQVSSLLDDIRGLVEEAANKGALSDAQVAANQLQIDSSLQAIDRISQTTQFQGKALLDGNLDFISQNVDASKMSNLQVNQANFGTSSQVSVNADVVAQATQANLTFKGKQLTSSATIEVGGSQGFQTFQFDAGATVQQVADAINLVSDATGVNAVLANRVATADRAGAVKMMNSGGADGYSLTAKTAGSSAGDYTIKYVKDTTTTTTSAKWMAGSPNVIQINAGTQAWAKAGAAAVAVSIGEGANTLTLAAKIAGSQFDGVDLTLVDGVGDTATYDYTTNAVTVTTNLGAKAGDAAAPVALGNGNTMTLAAKITGSQFNGVDLEITNIDADAEVASYSYTTNTITVNLKNATLAAAKATTVGALITATYNDLFTVTAVDAAGLNYVTTGTKSNLTNTDGDDGAKASDIAALITAQLGNLFTATAVDDETDANAFFATAGTKNNLSNNAGDDEVSMAHIDDVETAITGNVTVNAKVAFADIGTGNHATMLADLITASASIGDLNDGAGATQPNNRINLMSTDTGKNVQVEFAGGISQSFGIQFVNNTRTNGKSTAYVQSGAAAGTGGILKVVSNNLGSAYDGIKVEVKISATNQTVAYDAENRTLTVYATAAENTNTIRDRINNSHWGTDFTASTVANGVFTDGNYGTTADGAIYDSVKINLKTDANGIVTSTAKEVMDAINASQGLIDLGITATQPANSDGSGIASTGTITLREQGVTAVNIAATGTTAAANGSTAQMTVTAKTTGAAYANVKILFTDDVTAGHEYATYDATNKALTFHIQSGTTQANDLATAFSTGSDTAQAVKDLFSVTGAGAGAVTASDIGWTRDGVRYDGTSIGGVQSEGNFDQGQVIGTDGVKFTSEEYGTKQFVSVRALSGTFTTYATATDGTQTVSQRTTGTDANVRLNGMKTVADGLKVSLATATLDLSFDLVSSLTAGAAFSFQLTGGGALFQLGPDVVSNQQSRLGIGSVNSSRLGGTAGLLSDLKTGGTKSLTGDVIGAGKVVNQAIASVSTLRGRLGAFQKTTLDTNIATLSDTLQALTDAESTIRDADFAQETANMTRAQILSQSGLTVLKLANQSPQQVLSLLQ